MEHELKCWKEYYQAIVDGIKTFEIRQNDRNFQVDDILWLREWSSDLGIYTGRNCRKKVTYITSFMQQPGGVVMAIVPYHRPPAR
jgi:hypothetical protein